MGRARWPEEDAKWLAEHPEGLPPASPYRPAYVSPGRHSERKIDEPWKALTRAEVDAWRAKNLEERWATSDATAKALCWIEQAFGGTSDPEGH
jgi:hypothetical protein